jgi:hypothetical protein
VQQKEKNARPPRAVEALRTTGSSQIADRATQFAYAKFRSTSEGTDSVLGPRITDEASAPAPGLVRAEPVEHVEGGTKLPISSPPVHSSLFSKSANVCAGLCATELPLVGYPSGRYYSPDRPVEHLAGSHG